MLELLKKVILYYLCIFQRLQFIIIFKPCKASSRVHLLHHLLHLFHHHHQGCRASRLHLIWCILQGLHLAGIFKGASSSASVSSSSRVHHQGFIIFEALQESCTLLQGLQGCIICIILSPAKGLFFRLSR